MLKLASVMIGTKRPQALATFYEAVFGKPADMVNGERSFFSWQLGSVFFYVLEHSEMEGSSKDPGRVMFNFETGQVKEEFERIRTLGGQVIREPYEVQAGWFATLADPDGNYFQLVSPFPVGMSSNLRLETKMTTRDPLANSLAGLLCVGGAGDDCTTENSSRRIGLT